MRLLALTLALAALAATASPARADLANELPGLLDEVATAWTERQQEPDGRMLDGLTGRRSRSYGNAMLGYALLRSSERTGDPATREAGVRALTASLRDWRPNAFELWSAQTALRRAPGLPPDLTSALLERVRTVDELSVSRAAASCMQRRRCYSNLKLLGALATLRAGRRAAARDVIERRIPRVVDGALVARGRFGELRGSVLSDPRRNPLPYLAFSSWMMLRALDELGPSATPRAAAVTREALDATSALAGPDGDLAYMGRGQGQVWVPAVIVAAGVEGARRFPARARRYLGLAELAWARLRALHHRPGGVLRLVPGERSDEAGIDDYAGEVTYNGMALFALQHALDAGVPAVRRSPPPAAAGRVSVVDDAATGLAAVRRGDVWFAVHERMTHPTDLRYDFGLLALKHRDRNGWHDVLAPRPLTLGRRDAAATAGPVLVRDGRLGFPYGKRIAVGRGGVVTVRGLWRARNGDALRRGVIARYEPRRNGVTVVVPAEPGERFRAALFAPAGEWESRGRAIRTPQATVEFSSLSLRLLRRGWHSGPVRDLDRIEVRTRRSRGEPLKISYRAS